MNTEMTPETVAHEMFTVLHGQPATVVTRWTYRAADPFAVTLDRDHDTVEQELGDGLPG